MVDFSKRDVSEIERCDLNIKVAREFVEAFTGRAIISQAWKATDEKFPCGRYIKISKGPIKSVDSVKYWPYDGGAQATLSDSSYLALCEDDGVTIMLRTGYSWPSTDERPDAIEINFTAGYSDATRVLESLKQAIRVIAADEADYATQYITGTILTPVPNRIQSLLLPHKINGFC